MVDIKHPIRKILTQEEINKKEKEYETSQSKKRLAVFKEREDILRRQKEAADRGWNRVIITEKPRPTVKTKTPKKKPPKKKVAPKPKPDPSIELKKQLATERQTIAEILEQKKKLNEELQALKSQIIGTVEAEAEILEEELE